MGTWHLSAGALWGLDCPWLPKHEVSKHARKAQVIEKVIQIALLSGGNQFNFNDLSRSLNCSLVYTFSPLHFKSSVNKCCCKSCLRVFLAEVTFWEDIFPGVFLSGFFRRCKLGYYKKTLPVPADLVTKILKVLWDADCSSSVSGSDGCSRGRW